MHINCIWITDTIDERTSSANVSDDITLLKGDTKAVSIHVVDTHGAIVDITDASLSFSMHPYPGERYADKFLEPAAFTVACSLVDAEKGYALLPFTSSDTQGLTVGKYRFKIVLAHTSIDYIVGVGDINLMGL